MPYSLSIQSSHNLSCKIAPCFNLISLSLYKSDTFDGIFNAGKSLHDLFKNAKDSDECVGPRVRSGCRGSVAYPCILMTTASSHKTQRSWLQLRLWVITLFYQLKTCITHLLREKKKSHWLKMAPRRSVQLIDKRQDVMSCQIVRRC